MTLKLDMIQTTALAIMVLFLGQFLKGKLPSLDRYCIPAPVIGGLIFAIMALIFKQSDLLMFDLDVTIQKLCMTMFFTTIGFTASFRLLKKGGLQVFIFLALSITLVVLQDVTGVFLAKVFGLNPLIGLSTASVPMVGGHGTAGSFAPIFESKGAIGATTVAMAAATYGLISGSVIGGPIAKRLIEKNNLLKSTKTYTTSVEEEVAVTVDDSKELVPDNFMMATAQIFIAMGLGTIISMLLEKTGMTFPPYIGAMFAAAIIRNLSDSTNKYKIYGNEIDIMGSVSLSIFLATALMGLKLWQLGELAVPLVVMLLAQTVLMGAFSYFVTFNLMGRDYEASVIAAANCGFGMGATPNAMANMAAVTKKYMPAPKAFFIVPLVGSLFIDFFNAGIITIFMNIFGK